MDEIQVLPATAERFDAVQEALTGGGDGRACQCLWWMMSGTRFAALDLDEKRGLLRDEVGGSRPPGLVAEIDGVGAGWVRVGPRPTHERLGRSRIYGGSFAGSWDDDAVWTISCFSVRREFRGRGITRALLDAAVTFARDHGARLVEAYPLDTAAGKTGSNDLFHGALSTFLDAGFRESARPRPARPVVTLALT